MGAGGIVHLPALHSMPDPQVVPHAPQLLLSAWRSLQVSGVAPHSVEVEPEQGQEVAVAVAVAVMVVEGVKVSVAAGIVVVSVSVN